jgi:hypothetical protein
MPPVTLLGGAYEARSVIAGAQRCVNLYPEKNPQDSKSPVTHYPTGGFDQLARYFTQSGFRGCYQPRRDANKLFAVCGSRLLYIDDRFERTTIGHLKTAGRKSVSFADNGSQMLIVDGSPYGYVVDLETLELTTINEDYNFYGGSRVCLIDTYFVVAEPGSPVFRISAAGNATFDALDFAQKSGKSDPLVGAASTHRELWLIGEKSTEVWTNVGDVFPFQIVNGAFIESGCVAPASIASHGNAILWLSKDDNGQAIVAMTEGYRVRRVTTRAIEDKFTSMAKINDAIGMVYQFKGHLFYALTFPSANQTWVYDLVEDMWHEEVWSDGNGKENRIRAAAIAFAFGRVMMMDRQNGRIYFMDESNSAAIGGPIKRLRSTPVISQEGLQIREPQLKVDIEVGSLPAGANLTLRHSGNYGKTWSDGVIRSLGGSGEYDKQIIFNNLGQGRNRVFEVSWDGEGPTALNNVSISPQLGAK